MQYVIEYDCELKHFNAWAGAVSVLETLDGESYEIAEQFLEQWKEFFQDEPTDTDINDWLWFECEDFLREDYNLNLDGTPYDEED